MELTVVIGKRASDIKAAQAFDYVMGYTVAQDLSSRNWQLEMNVGQYLLGKVNKSPYLWLNHSTWQSPLPEYMIKLRYC